MPRTTWATDEQEEWLKSHKAAFLDAHQKKTLSKEFFPVIVKEFRDKWPPAEPTAEEVADASSFEEANKRKRTKYDKRTRTWFHNHTRNVSSNTGTGARGLLNLKGKPKMLHAWQAYQALTYETRWKDDVEKGWKEYRAQSDDDNPKKMTRLVYLMEFMKGKLSEETDEMKSEVEDYRRSFKEASPISSDLQARNLEFQAGIERIPPTLATIGKSIVEQTGWNTTILVGGPAPDEDGKIVTYLGHYGKNKEGLTFEKFLGSKDYDEHLLIPFERFLYSCFSTEDRESRRLIEAKPALENDKMEIGAESEDENEPVNNYDDEEKENTVRVEGGGDYLESRAKNIEMVRKLSSEFREELDAVLPKESKKKKPVSKKKGKKVQNEISVRRQSQRHNVLPTSESAPIPPQDPASTTVIVDEGAPSAPAGAETATPDTTPAADPMQVDPTALTVIVNESASSAPAGGETAIPVTTPATDPMQVDLTPALALQSDQPSAPSLRPSSIPTETAAPSGLHDSDAEPAPPHTSTIGQLGERSGGDVVAAHGISKASPLCGTSNTSEDNNLPPFLAVTIESLRGASADSVWQDLVTTLVVFEKSGPPSGKLCTTSRPEEVQGWIKSKKKTLVPAIEPGRYGRKFVGWWKALQPTWRIKANGSFGRDIPESEDWQSLKKGGSAGLYTLVMGLSWWIAANHEDADAWLIVDDLSWVLSQMSIPAPSIAKRSRENQEGDETQPRKSRRQF